MYPNQFQTPAPSNVPGGPMHHPRPALPPINAGWAAATVVFFWPLAFAAFNHSSRVFPLWSMGDYAGAQRASDQTKSLGKISLILWAILGLGILALYGFAIWAAIALDSDTSTHTHH
ncbi:CD225/dispanin family protein [Aldersonia sp. NBC_00410]|uniref:CD225/dispanin family protein n=1 Tax=Aldersonia sp. NBC_00410 TaxID=2975954 RepID=UPI0022541547|nr:CD225/dispanin family protein [Aldersonia sp. NBC_00410]MCX5042267.1 CD225/dispanin family protein [Aldersonia sp. NBC_00410]